MQGKPPNGAHDPAPQELAHAREPPVLEDIPLLIRLEREIFEEFREAMRVRLIEKIREVEASLRGKAPKCPKCERPMENRGRKSKSFLGLFGKIELSFSKYHCRPCQEQCRPLLETLGVEVGEISGTLARLLALLAVVVPYELAARLAAHFFGLEVSVMSVWRCVQRLGEACEQHTEAVARCHNDPGASPGQPREAPDAVWVGVDGCSLGMQVREHRRRRSHPDEKLAPLPPVEEGHFREVKTGALFLPAQRVEPSPGRRSVLRRVLVTCLGNADRIFELIWAKLQELAWLGPQTVVVVVGDGAEWIWNRASLFANRCEILDFWHAIEYAWDFARLRFGVDSKAGQRWVSRLAHDLRAGEVKGVLRRLRRLKARSDEEQDKLTALIRYYDTHQGRMRYDEYLRLGYGIGSGAVESAHKQVVHARLRQAGMRWSEAGARRLLALRLLLLNDEWSLLDRLVMQPVAVS
ncbi:MAG: ISKra4 family transposase [bacterium]|nr:ISKra4 family transposase [bacterium]